MTYVRDWGLHQYFDHQIWSPSFNLFIYMNRSFMQSFIPIGNRLAFELAKPYERLKSAKFEPFIYIYIYIKVWLPNELTQSFILDTWYTMWWLSIWVVQQNELKQSFIMYSWYTMWWLLKQLFKRDFHWFLSFTEWYIYTGIWSRYGNDLHWIHTNWDCIELGINQESWITVIVRRSFHTWRTVNTWVRRTAGVLLSVVCLGVPAPLS